MEKVDIMRRKRKEEYEIDPNSSFNKLRKLQMTLKEEVALTDIFFENRDKLLKKIQTNCYEYFKERIAIQEIYDNSSYELKEKNKKLKYEVCENYQSYLPQCSDIISKILLTYKFVLPQNLIFIKGAFNFGMHLIIFPILWLTKKIDSEIFLINFDSGIDIIFMIIKLLFSFLKSFCIMKIIDIFSPLHVAFVNVVLCLYQFILSIFLTSTGEFGTCFFSSSFSFNNFNLFSTKILSSCFSFSQ